MKTGKQLKLEILDDIEIRRSQFISMARNLARSISRERGQVSINDIREKYPLPDDVHPSAYGAVFRGPLWKVIGYTAAKHSDAHGRLIRIYKWNEGDQNGW